MISQLGKYRILETIGRGGMGTVLKAHDPVLDRIVALKVISTDIEVTDELRTRFFREAKATAKLAHPNIVTIYDLGEDDGRLYIVMEFMEGAELRRIIRDQATLSLAEKITMMVQVCEGLGYAHDNGIVHRDIKPGNIFVMKTGQVKILDFGIAHMAVTEGLTRTGLIMGTLRYISPEQIRGRVDHRSDIFSVGLVFYELLAYRVAFAFDDPMALLEALRTTDPPPLADLVPGIPADLCAVIDRAVRKDPADRFQSAREMGKALQEIRRSVQNLPEPRVDPQRPLGVPPAGPGGLATDESATRPLGVPPRPDAVTALPAPPISPAPARAGTPRQERAMALVRAASDHMDRDEIEAAAQCTREALDLEPDLPELAALQDRIRASTTQRYRRREASLAPTEPPAPREGVRYQALTRLGDGPSGAVFLAWDRLRMRPAALKVVIPGATIDRDRFERSAQEWMSLPEHRNVVEVYDVAVHEGRPCIVMEFLEGKTLDRLILERSYLSLTDKVSLITQLCAGVAHLHKHGIVHKDIRPSSVFVRPDGQLKLLESGIARFALPPDPEATRTRFMLDDYRAPEQARGRWEPRSDIFSVGAVLFELLTHLRLPLTHAESALEERLRSAQPPVPEDIVSIVHRAVKRDENDRFTTIEEMARPLARYLHRSPRVVFALHGIRTHWAWQRALTEVAEAHHWRCRMDDWSFGYLSLFRFLLPWQRRTKIEWFRKTYETEVRSRDVELQTGEYPSVVAHSFGTYILGNALLAYTNIRFDKVILCGSILPRDFPWDVLIERGQVQAVRNEYGTRDVWTQIVRWFVRGTGPSGRSKFIRPHERLDQEEFLYDHSEYFDKGHMRQKWFVFLECPLPEIPESSLRVTAPATRPPVALYLAYGVLLVGLGWLTWQLFG